MSSPHSDPTPSDHQHEFAEYNFDLSVHHNVGQTQQSTAPHEQQSSANDVYDIDTLSPSLPMTMDSQFFFNQVMTMDSLFPQNYSSLPAANSQFFNQDINDQLSQNYFSSSDVPFTNPQPFGSYVRTIPNYPPPPYPGSANTSQQHQDYATTTLAPSMLDLQTLQNYTFPSQLSEVDYQGQSTAANVTNAPDSLALSSTLPIPSTSDSSTLPIPSTSDSSLLPQLENTPVRRGKEKCKCPNCLTEGGNQTTGADGRQEHNCHFLDCKEIYGKPADLKEHLQTHPDYNSLACTVCGKMFTESSHLCRHVKKHIGAKKYVCKYCQAGFVRNDSLKYHVRTVHEDPRPRKQVFTVRRRKTT